MYAPKHEQHHRYFIRSRLSREIFHNDTQLSVAEVKKFVATPLTSERPSRFYITHILIQATYVDGICNYPKGFRRGEVACQSHGVPETVPTTPALYFPHESTVKTSNSATFSQCFKHF